VLAQSPTVNNICNKWVQGAARTSDGAATAFTDLRKAGRAAMLADNCRRLALEDKHTDDLAIAMDHKRKTADTDYSPSSSTVTAGQETLYKNLQNRFIQAACIETALPKFQGHLADVLESVVAIAGGTIPPPPQLNYTSSSSMSSSVAATAGGIIPLPPQLSYTSCSLSSMSSSASCPTSCSSSLISSSASSASSSYSSSMSSSALASGSKSGLHPHPLPPPTSMRLPTEPPAIILSLLPSPSSKSSSSSSVSSIGPPPITLSLFPLAGDCDALEIEPTRVDVVPVPTAKPLAATAALAPIVLSLLPAAGACDPLEPTLVEAVPTTEPLAVAVASQSATTARHNAIATLVERQMSSHELTPPPLVIQRAIMILVTGEVLSFGGIGTGNELEDAAHLCARQALQSELETDAIACGRPRPHESAAHLMSQTYTLCTVPRREHESLCTMSSCDIDIGAQPVLAEGAPPAAEAISVIRAPCPDPPAAPCLDPPAGTLFAMRPRSRRGPPVRAVATHLAGLARARPLTAFSTRNNINSVAGEWRLRLCWLGRQTPTLVSLEAICCGSNDGQLPQLALQWMDDAVALASRNDPTVVDWWAGERARRSNTLAPPRPNFLVEDELEEHTDGEEKSSSEDTEDEEVEDRADDGNINGEINGVEEMESFKSPPIGIFQPSLSWSDLMERSQHLQPSLNTCSAASSAMDSATAMSHSTTTMSSYYEDLRSCVMRAAAAADAYGDQKRKAPSTPSNEPKSQSSGAKKIKVGHEEPLYEVEALLGKETRRGGGNRCQEWFLVKWKGFPHTENTWEPKENLPRQMVTAFEAWLDR
jgi:hypothetical protein